MKRLSCLFLAATMALTLAACGGGSAETPAPENTTPAESTPAETAGAVISGVEDGVLTVGMECAYAPYNWTQMDDSNGAVPIVNNPGSYANGYDVMMAQKVCDTYGWELEVMALEWGGLAPALAAGTIDVAIAGQSMTAERMAEVDMAGPYYYATIVCVTTKDSPNASATSISELSGACTAQSGTIWYDSCLPQIEGADIQPPADTAPAMIMALESGTVDFICTDLPTANGAVAKNSDLVVLNFSGTDGDFQFASEEERAENVNIGVSVKKGNTELQTAMNDVFSTMTEDDFNALMDEAIAIQPAV
ncbi:MAG TPA: transporter substrate-binding domain-containing protein [Candidatus Intestinimonas pullistercoris]|uniref:Transporter substrate-binding domain-containing protein n=1 Tax=Candidatus Intestinimonas pullistercoris TaxID=2838623 RepID=A0A9D2T1C9_9FIRM|nr:transporter substrate-binding domain-containing protein [uncultured Intestinimonas sp.]HJC41490.1 transporter substrate-binding domain-containing protein [Candidatus Intestinimonas pullistercoris]